MNYETPRDALTGADAIAASANERTNNVSLINTTGWTIVVSFTQLQDLSGNVPQGFVKDTGVIVLGSNAPGPSTLSIDPGYAGGSAKLCQATRVTCNYKLQWPGDPQTYDHECPTADDGDLTTYFDHVSWTIRYTKGVNREGRPNAEIVPEKSKKSAP